MSKKKQNEEIIIEEESKFNTTVFIVLLIFSFPLAIIYALLSTRKKRKHERKHDHGIVKIGRACNYIGLVFYGVATGFCLKQAFTIASEQGSIRVGLAFLVILCMLIVFVLTIVAGKHILFNFFSLVFSIVGAVIYLIPFDGGIVRILTCIGLALCLIGVFLCMFYHLRCSEKPDPKYKGVIRQLRLRKVLNILFYLGITYLSFLPWLSVIKGLERFNPIYLLLLNQTDPYILSFFISWLICGILVYIIKRGNPIDGVVTFKDTTVTEEYEMRDVGFLSESYAAVKTGEKTKEDYHDIVVFKFGFILYILFFIFVGPLNVIGLLVSLFTPARYRKVYPCIGMPKGKTLPAEFVLHTGTFAMLMQFWIGFLLIDGDGYIEYLYRLKRTKRK